MGYQSKMLTVPFEWLSKILLFSTVDHLVQDCKYYGIHVDPKLKAVKFLKADFIVANPVVRANPFDLRQLNMCDSDTYRKYLFAPLFFRLNRATNK